ncbi:uncharacterized protein J7T54_006449 [Emericellopsis cladophorae]|uniref:Uncharacterized protein n=1 Tax=Emericellopsis cladophorae TaxID=2686198 RepID=A0A9P9Y6G1_9HYPO|nr:uncharacterized protein J7T54_006449 [Emericellopsis cladophorae]KAI6784404.1 hypothetical protein J7T54_006449 [Emericellopsis cladophorae]
MATTSSTPSPPTQTPTPRLLAIPQPLRRLFNAFPLQTLPPNALPHRAPPSTTTTTTTSSSSIPRLYIFTDNADDGRPSYNPSCLKAQAALRIAGVHVHVEPSNNHASPSGALPFLLTETGQVLAGGKIFDLARARGALPTVKDAKIQAYRALLDNAVRPAWLYALYLNPRNATLLARLYLPSNPLLAVPTSTTLTQAASAEILKTTRTALINPLHLLSSYREALDALSTLLGEHDWFFGDAVGLFDAEVFAYTWLVGSLAWDDGAMEEVLQEFGNLVRHRERLYQRCWGHVGEKVS